MSSTNDQQAHTEAAVWDGQVAQIFPQNVEKLPLFHWYHGKRMLCIGSRDGAAFDQNISAAENNTFHRPLSLELLQASEQKLATDGMCVNMSASLWFPEILQISHQAAQDKPFVICTPGFGDPQLLDQYLAVVDAWVLMIDSHPGPLCDRIMREGSHVEVLWGLDDDLSKLDLPWDSVSAIHLRPRTALQALDDLQLRYDAARSILSEVSQKIIIYDDIQQHSHCVCGETLIWRQGGRSRIDCLDQSNNACGSCGRAVPWL
ncbi:MAG: hypothetical protein HRU15_01140 [Planctomycetes bacterium]|nr:hypothetical protein [Planctomycetota bacterium]